MSEKKTVLVENASAPAAEKNPTINALEESGSFESLQYWALNTSIPFDGPRGMFLAMLQRGVADLVIEGAWPRYEAADWFLAQERGMHLDEGCFISFWDTCEYLDIDPEKLVLNLVKKGVITEASLELPKTNNRHQEIIDAKKERDIRRAAGLGVPPRVHLSIPQRVEARAANAEKHQATKLPCNKSAPKTLARLRMIAAAQRDEFFSRIEQQLKKMKFQNSTTLPC